MSTNIPMNILSLRGQQVDKIRHDKMKKCVVIHCNRDRRFKVIDPHTKKEGTVNQCVRRQVRDVPLMGLPCVLDIELAQVRSNNKQRRIENCAFVDKRCRYSKRLCQLVSGLCRHMSIQVVSRHLNIRWSTVKNIDKFYLESTLPALAPEQLTNLKYLGVDEVAEAKGHDYMTVIYDMESGHLIEVETGRTAETFSGFLKSLPKETSLKIKAIAMDMGPVYQKSVREYLPNADIVFDRFNVMQNYNKVLSNQRRTEFRKEDESGKELLKGTHYLVLKNANKLNESQAEKLKKLLNENTNLNTLYVMKEQLQNLWKAESAGLMQEQLEAWCLMAEKTSMHHLIKFAKSLRKHCVGICNYAKYRLTSARIEAGNISIGMILKRARGIKDTKYFKLKIRQSSIPDKQSMFYAAA